MQRAAGAISLCQQLKQLMRMPPQLLPFTAEQNASWTESHGILYSSQGHGVRQPAVSSGSRLSADPFLRFIKDSHCVPTATASLVSHCSGSIDSLSACPGCIRIPSSSILLVCLARRRGVTLPRLLVQLHRVEAPTNLTVGCASAVRGPERRP